MSKNSIFWVTGFMVGFIFLFTSQVYGGWKNKIVLNQIKTVEYVELLKRGANPDKTERPRLRRDKKTKASLANKEMREIMTNAENLARSGKHHLIKKPDFSYNLVSEERYKSLKNDYKKKSK